MRRAVVLVLALACLTGCATMKKTFFGWPNWKEVEDEDGETVRVTTTEAQTKKEKIKKAKAILNVDKKQAITAAREFASGEGFGDLFDLKRPSKISRYMTEDSDPRWRWQVYFSSKSRSFWKFWRRSPMMVEIDGVSGEILQWGRR